MYLFKGFKVHRLVCKASLLVVKSQRLNMSLSTENVVLNNGVKMPILGLGTWKSKAGEVKEAVKVAICGGYRHIDCAMAYGNESEVGAALKEVMEEGVVKREELFIVSKLWNSRHQPQDVEPSCLETLGQLGLDYLDLYLVHWPHSFKSGKELFPRGADGNVMYADIPLMDTWGAMEKLVDKGLVKSIGVSNYNSQQIQHILDSSRIKPAVNQVEIHPYYTNDPLVRFCQTRGVAITAYSPFGSPDRPSALPTDPVLLEEPDLLKVAEKYKKTTAQVILRWLIQRGIIVIPKSVTPARIQQNGKVFDFTLTSHDMDVVAGLNTSERILVPIVEKDGKREYRDKDAPNFPFNIDF